MKHTSRHEWLPVASGSRHIAIGVDDLDATFARLAEQGIEPERPTYQVRDGGSRICPFPPPSLALGPFSNR